MAGSPSRTLVLTLTAVTDKFKKGLGDAEKQVGGFGEKLGNFAKKGALALAALGAAAGALAIKIGKDAINAASDLSEELSKSSELFGDSAAAIDAWAQTAAGAFGQSRRQALQASGNFAIFGRSAGLADQELVDFSTDFTELASDLASFNNTSPEDAVQALGAALRGESEPIRRYGILLNDAGLRQKAFELGLISTTKDALTPQQRVLAAQAAIYEQVGAAAGDFARTSDGLANSQRILAANVEDVKAGLGEALLPIAERFTGVLVELIPKVRDWATQLGERVAPFLDKAWDNGKKLVADVGEWWNANGENIINTFKRWADNIKTAGDNFSTFIGAVIENLRAGGTFDRLEDRFASLRGTIGETGEAWADFRDSLDAPDTEKRVVNFAFLIDTYIVKPFESVIWLIEQAISLFNTFLGIAAEYNRFKAQIEASDAPSFRDRFGPTGPPATFTVPGQSVVINFNGPTNPEAAAREVRRILGDSDRRTGFQPIGAR
jgi:hypothetical protein